MGKKTILEIVQDEKTGNVIIKPDKKLSDEEWENILSEIIYRLKLSIEEIEASHSAKIMDISVPDINVKDIKLRSYPEKKKQI